MPGGSTDGKGRYVTLLGMSQDVVIAARHVSIPARSGVVLPRLVAAAGPDAARRFLEFFAATIRNRNTRMAYARAVGQFFAWCDRHRIGELADIEPLHIAAYIEALQGAMAKPSVKQHLAAIRMLFDWLVTGHIVAVNPATSVRGPKHVVRRGKTSVLAADEARALLDSIDITTLVGLRDRALIALLTFSFARIGAAVAMRVEDYYPQRQGTRRGALQETEPGARGGDQLRSHRGDNGTRFHRNAGRSRWWSMAR